MCFSKLDGFWAQSWCTTLAMMRPEVVQNRNHINHLTCAMGQNPSRPRWHAHTTAWVAKNGSVRRDRSLCGYAMPICDADNRTNYNLDENRHPNVSPGRLSHESVPSGQTRPPTAGNTTLSGVRGIPCAFVHGMTCTNLEVRNGAIRAICLHRKGIHGLGTGSVWSGSRRISGRE